MDEITTAQEAWDGIKASFRHMMPGVSDHDCVMLTRVVVREIYRDGPTLDELRAEHRAEDRPHDSTCAVCGFLDSALYHQQTGRYLTDAMTHAKRRG